jgi:hypothetical protein
MIEALQYFFVKKLIEGGIKLRKNIMKNKMKNIKEVI